MRNAWAGLVVLTTLLAAPALEAASLSIYPYGPAPGTNDISNFTGAGRDGLNVCDGAVYADGGANDAFTYVAGDRANQGQTFSTGANTNGCVVNAIWVRHVGYSTNTALTYWRMDAGVTLTLRVTDPVQAGSTNFAIRAETYTTTGSEGWSGGLNSANGDGYWLRFALAAPLTLATNRAYGFDLTSAAAGAFFEWLGTSNSVFANGYAYKGAVNGTPDNTLTPLPGDRVFLIEMAGSTATNTASATNYPALAAALTSAEAFPNERVQLLASRFNANREMHRTGYLGWLNTNADRLLWPFRNNAGLAQPAGASNLGGWEGTSGFTAVRGHMAGHFLTAASRLYGDTGDTNFLNTINYLVAELRKVQNALSTNEIAAGRPYGYLSAFPSTFFTTLEATPASAQVPFYTVHKIFAGLVDAYRYTTNNLALDMAAAMSDYHNWRIAQLTVAQVEAMFRTDNGNSEEWGGMNEALTDLYLLSNARGDANAARHLAFAKVFHRDWFIDPLTANTDQLNGLHANTHIPQVVGFARVASVLNTNDSQRPRLYSAASNFWHIVIGQHWLVPGGNSYSEHFSTPGRETGPGGSALAWNTAENCNTYNMLKLTRQLFMQNPSVEYGDYYEHALYNQIVGALETNGGMMAYFAPLNPGNFKTYCKPEGACWCDTGTGIENPARYNEAIYFHKTDTLWVNLFIPSILNWTERGLSVRLDSGFPATNTVRLTFTCARPTNAAVRVRIPSWVAATPAVTVNGANPGLTPVPGAFLELNRAWSSGDVVELTLPMSLRVDRSMDDPSQASLFYGPILLAGDLGTNGMPASDLAQDQWDYSGVATVAAPALVGGNPDDPASWVQPGGSPLAFQAPGAFPGDATRTAVQLRPYYDTHHTRYAVYWKFVAPSSFSAWSGNAGSPEWSLAGNWNSPPTNQCAVQFGPAAGGTVLNDLAAGSLLGGIQFLPGADGFVLNGNSIALRGDILNASAAAQRINLPLLLSDNLPWIINTASGSLALGGELGGQGSLIKSGAQTLTLLSNATFTGSVRVAAGTLEIGDGGASGSLGDRAATVDAGAALAFNRGNTFAVSGPVGGAGSVIKRGAGTMELSGLMTNTGPTIIEAGTLQIATRQVQSLAHRWSFNNSLADSAGTNNATVVDVGTSNTTLTATAITLAGGARTGADYVSLGSGLLPKDGSPATIELWAAQVSARNWSRVFDVGSSSTENLLMAWSQGTDTNTDRVEWKDAVTATANNTCAPYAPGVEQHIVMVIEPNAGAGGTTRVTWYAAPSASPGLGAARGSFDTANTLAGFNDANFWLGRSEYTADATANATYNEVRLWNRAFTAAELQSLHALGPDSVGTFATSTLAGRLPAQSDLQVRSGAALNLAGTTQQVASLSGATNSAIQLGGGQLRIGTGTNAATFAGSITGPGSVVVNGALRLVGAATIAPGVVLTNNGTLDIITWTGTLPAGFVNQGTVLTRSLLRLGPARISGNDFTVSLQGYSGHAYQLQACDNLAAAAWTSIGSPVIGNDAPIQLEHPAGAAAPQRYYRVTISP